MKRILWIAVLALLVANLPALAQKTPAASVAAYDSLADAILALRTTESNFVMAILDHHHDAAKRAYEAGNWERAAANMALFANEGDNAVAGIRKRLVEGGHHHNAAGEEAGLYDEGFVIVTKTAKRQALGASKAMLEAKDTGAREEAWSTFEKIAKELVYAPLKSK